MGVSKNMEKDPNHPFVHRVFQYKPSILGVFPLFLEIPLLTFMKSTVRTSVLAGPKGYQLCT